MAKKATLKSGMSMDRKIVLAVLGLVALLGFIIYNSQAAVRPKRYSYNSKGITHDKGEATADSNFDTTRQVWRSSGDPADGAGYSWKGPNTPQKKGEYVACFYVKALEAENGIYYDVVADGKVVTATEDQTQFTEGEEAFHYDCINYTLRKDAKKVQWRATVQVGTVDIAWVRVSRGD